MLGRPEIYDFRVVEFAKSTVEREIVKPLLFGYEEALEIGGALFFCFREKGICGGFEEGLLDTDDLGVVDWPGGLAKVGCCDFLPSVLREVR